MEPFDFGHYPPANNFILDAGALRALTLVTRLRFVASSFR